LSLSRPHDEGGEEKVNGALILLVEGPRGLRKKVAKLQQEKVKKPVVHLPG